MADYDNPNLTLRERVEAFLGENPRGTTATRICRVLRIDENKRGRVHEVMQAYLRRTKVAKAEEKKAKTERLRTEMWQGELNKEVKTELQRLEEILQNVNPDDPTAVAADVMRAALVALASPTRLAGASIKDLMGIVRGLHEILHPAPATPTINNYNVQQSVGILPPAEADRRLTELRRKERAP